MSDVVEAGAADGAAPAVADYGPRWITGMPEEDYFSHSALSASQMKVLLQSPKHFQAARHEEPPPKGVFDVGHAVHARVLGVGQPVALIPSKLLSADGGIRSNEAKQWVEDARAGGAIPLKAAVYNHVVAASEAVLQNPKARALLEVGGDREVSMFATDPETGIRLRGRADSADPATGTLLDVKTCRGLSLRFLAADVDSYGYDLSGEVYRFLFALNHGVDAGPMHLIFTEKEPPYDVRVVKLGVVWQDGGWQKLRRALELYRACVEAGVWPGVDDLPGPVEELDAPGWYAARVSAAELEVL